MCIYKHNISGTWNVDWRGERGYRKLKPGKAQELQDLIFPSFFLVLFLLIPLIYTLFQFLKTAYKVGHDLAPACLQDLAYRLFPFLTRFQLSLLLFYSCCKLLPVSELVCIWLVLPKLIVSPFAWPTLFFKLQLGVTSLRDPFSVVPLLKIHRHEYKTYNTSNPFTPLLSLFCAKIIKGETSLDFEIITRTVVCLLSLFFTSKAFGLCMLLFIALGA